MMPKRFIVTTAITLGLSQLQACSMLYDIQQDIAQDKCTQILDHYQRSECLRRNKTSFEQYQQQREEVLRK